MRVAPIYRHDALHSGMDDKFATDQRDLQVVPKTVINREKSKPKLSAVGQNFPMDMTWERLILLSLSKKRLSLHQDGIKTKEGVHQPFHPSSQLGRRDEVNNLAGGAWRGLEESRGLWEMFWGHFQSSCGLAVGVLMYQASARWTRRGRNE